jgi:hypothetical protein
MQCELLKGLHIHFHIHFTTLASEFGRAYRERGRLLAKRVRRRWNQQLVENWRSWII